MNDDDDGDENGNENENENGELRMMRGWERGVERDGVA